MEVRANILIHSLQRTERNGGHVSVALIYTKWNEMRNGPWCVYDFLVVVIFVYGVFVVRTIPKEHAKRLFVKQLVENANDFKHFAALSLRFAFDRIQMTSFCVKRRPPNHQIRIEWECVVCRFASILVEVRVFWYHHHHHQLVLRIRNQSHCNGTKQSE